MNFRTVACRLACKTGLLESVAHENEKTEFRDRTS